MISCRELLDLQEFQHIKLIAGREGLQRVISWTYIVQTNTISEWVQGRELLFITGVGINTSVSGLLNIFQEAIEKKVGGVIILKNHQYIKEIPKEIIEFSDKNNLPLFDMPWNLKLLKVTKEITDLIISEDLSIKNEENFIDKVLFNHSENHGETYEIAKLHKIKLHEFSSVGVIKVTTLNNISIINLLREDIYEAMKSVYFKKSIEIFSKATNCEIIFFFSYETIDLEDDIKDYLIALYQKLIKTRKDIIISVGLGRSINDIDNIKTSYKDSIKCIEFSRVHVKVNDITTYNDLGVYGLLFDIENKETLREFSNEILKKLILHDEKISLEYIRTLKYYLLSTDNLNGVAKSLNIHKNTLVYRLDKIKSILKKDLQDPNVRLNLLSAIFIKEINNF